MRHPEGPVHALLDVAALLLADDDHGPVAEAAEAGHDRGVVGAAAIAVELDPVLDQPLDVIERVGALVVAGELDRRPDLVVRRLGLHALELALELLELALEARAAEELQVPQLGEPLRSS